MVTERVIDFFQAIKVGVENYRHLVVASNRREMCFGDCQEATPIVESRKFVYERQALQCGFSTFAFSDVLNLKDEMCRIIVSVTHERYTV